MIDFDVCTVMLAQERNGMLEVWFMDGGKEYFPIEDLPVLTQKMVEAKLIPARYGKAMA